MNFEKRDDMRRELEEFFRGTTFEDFLLEPRKGVLFQRKDAELSMPLTRNIGLIGLPVIPANMITVTGGRMTVAAALNGTIGILPRSYSIDAMVERIRYVKRQQAYIIENPLVIHCDATLKEARDILRVKKVSGLLVEEKPGSMILAGILSHRDIFGPDSDLVKSHMTLCPPRVIFAAPDVSMEEAEKMMHENRIEKLPLLGDDRKIVGLITMRDLKTAKRRPHVTKDSKGRLMVGATIGAKRGSDYMVRAEAAISAEADLLLIDIAHGHSVVMEEAVKNIRAKYPHVELIVGNVATREGAKFLVELGADAIKVGIGPGSGCRTRLETGFGVPQMEAIRKTWLGVRFDCKSDIPIIADGGTKYAGDIAKAIACGASSVMLGSLFAGTDEAPGTLFSDPVTKRPMKKYGGETSPEIKLDQYTMASEDDDESEGPVNFEGQMKPVPAIGPVSDLFRGLRQSLQSSVSYGGVEKLSDFHLVFTDYVDKHLIRLSQAARDESFIR